MEQLILKLKSGIKIKPSHKGLFTNYCGGTSECIRRGKNSSNPTIRKRATFAQNARRWKHQKGGIIKPRSPLAEKDSVMGSIKNYGWTDSLNTETGTWNRKRLYESVNPADGFQFGDFLRNGMHYFTLSDARAKGTRGDEAFWRRHLGYSRDYSEMPAVGIRFSGDYNKDGSLRLPNAEYTGIPNYAKKAILERIKDEEIPTDSWKVIEENWRHNDNRLTQYANFSIRNNNGSGIYDVYDTYDFPNKWSFPNINRAAGKQIEIRDTIWGPNANPKLYKRGLKTKKDE